MERKFRGSSGRCNNAARAAVRLGFHDAGTWSKTTGYGGADGSIILANEGGRPENNGLQEISATTLAWYKDYKRYGVGMADLIQFGATVATVVCPLGPRVRTYIGRKDSSVPNADNLLPNVFAEADELIKLFENKTIRAHGLTALVGAHTTSQQRFVDPKRANDPQDSTPGIWDVKFYGQTAGTESVPPRVFKFPSDVKLSQHPKTADEWKEFSGNGQDHWNEVRYFSRQFKPRLRLVDLYAIEAQKLTSGPRITHENTSDCLSSVSTILTNSTNAPKFCQELSSLTELLIKL